MSNSIDFIINGKNNAANAMVSVEKLLKRITTAYLAFQATALSVAKINQVNAAYDAQAEALKKLNAALQIRGAQSMSGPMQQVAKDLEKLTGISDQTTLGLMQQAQSMGFATDRMDDAAKAALGLAAATGKDASASLGDMKAALEGNFEAFHGLNPQIMYMRTNQEKLAAVMAIANQGLKAQSQDMGTVSGSGRRADSAMTTLMETFGKIIAPIRVLINAGLQQLSESLTNLLAPAAEYATKVMENIGPMMEWIKQKVVDGINVIIGAWTMFEVILTNLDSVWEIVKASAEMAMISIVESIKHAFTVRIPAYAMWFVENFPNLIRDGLNLAFTFVKNRLQQIADAVAAMFVFLETGGKTDVLGQLGEIAGRNLVEGFKSSLTDLPTIAARQITEREKDLAEKIGAVGGRLGDQFTKKMKDRMLGVGGTLSSELDAATRNINLQGRASVMTGGIQATEGRLLTRGPGTRLPDQIQEIIRLLKNPPPPPAPRQRILVQIDPQQMQTWDQIQQNTSNTLQMEAIA